MAQLVAIQTRRAKRMAIGKQSSATAAKKTRADGAKDRWEISWQITPRVLTAALAAGGAETKRAFAAMMDMGKINVAKIEAASRGRRERWR